MNDNNINEIERSIFALVLFFDIFDFPLTSFEVWKYLSVTSDLFFVEEILSDLVSSGKIQQQQGFVFLPGRESIIVERLQRYNYAERKFARVAWVARVFKFIPWVKMIAVGNLIGAGNLRDGGDIDIFIITQKNRLWLSRFFCTALMKISRMRPRPGDERDKICLSFFVSETALNLENLLLDNDWYLVYWLACLQVIFDRDQSYQKLIKNNQWLKDKLPNWFPAIQGTRHEIVSFPDNIFFRLIDLIFSKLEKFMQKWQINHFPPEIKILMNKDTRVIASETIIKLHTNDRREYFRGKFLEKL